MSALGIIGLVAGVLYCSGGLYVAKLELKAIRLQAETDAYRSLPEWERSYDDPNFVSVLLMNAFVMWPVALSSVRKDLAKASNAKV